MRDFSSLEFFFLKLQQKKKFKKTNTKNHAMGNVYGLITKKQTFFGI